jgi:hypothetical protein
MNEYKKGCQEGPSSKDKKYSTDKGATRPLFDRLLEKIENDITKQFKTPRHSKVVWYAILVTERAARPLCLLAGIMLLHLYYPDLLRSLLVLLVTPVH